MVQITHNENKDTELIEKDEGMAFDSDDIVVVGRGATAAAAVAVPAMVLCFGDEQVATSPDALTVDGLRLAMNDAFGYAAKLAPLYFLKHESAKLEEIFADEDVERALNSLGEPVKILAIPAVEATEKVSVPVEDTFVLAAHALKAFGVDAPPDELAKLLRALQLPPRRLVKAGLAPREALDGATPREALPPTGSFEEAKEEPEPDVVVAFLRSRGVGLAAKDVHGTLRVLRVAPRRFARLGLDVGAVRAAYEHGVDDAMNAALAYHKINGPTPTNPGWALWARAWGRWGARGAAAAFRGRRHRRRGQFQDGPQFQDQFPNDQGPPGWRRGGRRGRRAHDGEKFGRRGGGGYVYAWVRFFTPRHGMIGNGGRGRGPRGQEW